MKVSMNKVESSTITEIGHDKEAHTMYVRFAQSGKLYSYQGITPEFFNEFSAAESKGSFFGKNIRKQFTGSLVDETKAAA